MPGDHARKSDGVVLRAVAVMHDDNRFPALYCLSSALLLDARDLHQWDHEFAAGTSASGADRVGQT